MQTGVPAYCAASGDLVLSNIKRMKRTQGKHITRDRRCLCLFFFILVGFPLSCTSPAGVSEFARSAQRVLLQSPDIFRDIDGSCGRRHADAAPINPVFMPAKSTGEAASSSENPVCAPFRMQGDGLIQASDILSAYFRAMQELASFNTSAVSSTSQKAGENAGFTAKFNTTQADSVGKLAALVTQLLTERYQRTQLLNFLREADPAIDSVTQALEDVVSKDYLSLLREEQQSLTAQYQNVGDTGNTAIILLLNRSYTDELNQLNRRKTIADAYVRALGQIREGHHQLALNVRHLKSKEITMALQPYTARLQGLVPTLQNGF